MVDDFLEEGQDDHVSLSIINKLYDRISLSRINKLYDRISLYAMHEIYHRRTAVNRIN
jgi:hypothetical protein